MLPQSLIREVHCNEVSEPGFPAVQAIFKIALEWGASKKLVIALLRLAYKRTAFAAGTIMTHILDLYAMRVVDIMKWSLGFPPAPRAEIPHDAHRSTNALYARTAAPTCQQQRPAVLDCALHE
jgi:hypothetical protein